VPGVRLDVAGHDRSQQASLGTGTQHNYFSASPVVAEPFVSIVPPAGRRDERFPLRGRERLLGEILETGDGRGVRVIHGLGGCGKTSLAMEAAHRLAQRGAEVWWVPAGEERRFLAGMRALGRSLGVTDEEARHGEAADLIWRLLTMRRQEWLLVIDNADDPQVLAAPGMSAADGTGWLRPVDSPAGLVLVTTRDGRAGSWGPWCRLHPVGMLAVTEAAQVLADRTKSHHSALGGDADAEALAERLGRLPLALRIAGSFLAEMAEIPLAFADPGLIRSYHQYREALQHGQFHAAFPSSDAVILTQDQARGVVGRTWELTLNQLASRQFPEARKILRLLACLADAPVPHELLIHPPDLAGSELFPGISGPRLWQVLQALAGFGLIDFVGGETGTVPRVIRLHPLVRDTSRPGSRDERAAYLALAASLLRRAADATGWLDDPAAAQSRWQALAPHAFHVFETLTAAAGFPSDAITAAAEAADKAANYQAAQGLIIAAEETLRAVLRIRVRILGTDHLDTIATRFGIARRLAERADYSHAETECNDVLEARRRILGPEHPSTLNTWHEMAAMISFRGDYAQAEAEYREVLAIKLRVLGPDHKDTLITRHEIARMMSAQGNYAEAEAEFRSILASSLHTLGPDHYSTLVTRSQLARTMAAQGQHARAETELRDILAVQARLLGLEHLRTLWTRRQLSLTMAAQGNYAGAETELRDVLARRLRTLPDHPETLAIRQDLARVMASRGNTEPEPSSSTC
jgi:tetratricopeptide (TPR) repeat protein